MHIKNIVAIGGGGFGRSLGSLAIEKYIMRTNLRMTYLIKSGHTTKIIIDDSWTYTSSRKSFTSIK